MADASPVKRALISVSDKTGIVDFARRLAAAGVDLVSTGGTARALREAGLTVSDVSDVTEFPEMMDGRIKTLHPRIHGGLLALRDDEGHLKSMRDHDIAGIELLVVNLYPFEETVAKGAGFEDCIENIDIGGPAMIRAAAKNHRFVGVVTDPADYETVLGEVEGDGALKDETKKRLAAKAFAKTASYDSAISRWFAQQNGETFPKDYTLAGKLDAVLRYGENPHQEAAFYRTGGKRPGVATAEQAQGKELSYNNLNDTDAAYELIAEFGTEKPAVAIIKHANPCGVAAGEDMLEAYLAALRCDPVSAFGGIVALNQKLTGPVAEKIVETFTEVVIAPDADEAAKQVFAKKKNLRLLIAGGVPDPQAPGMTIKPLAGGFLLQSRDAKITRPEDLKVVTKRQPTDAELADMLFAFKVAKHVKSNAIVYAKDGATVGIGAGQMSRLDSSRIAARKSEDAAKACGAGAPLAKGSVVASDAFFPFADGLLSAAEAGATAVIQPGGSMRDDDVINAADEAGLAMVFTGVRHFRH
ncbi:bifunctional phosphoribosylaminoimidazolecarboxamide formyltransferase/IMP cyclohydrolase [Hyphococcus luteus]|uniref:Bifunctional purine biosynthesis protein PurH n=1 Tax=Hyphococcus luteus TaxID=2058213 RepID=A0A2S7K1Y4_9PROT|nr:bifunctional phosphoribosylaminoimidazolecarboxamide formyltransferase/IMP cyclohydrolase [Marinicaulis flavus]PQA86519.1 bifunctional phosphoribosylaminoimidazolecarboxamide formyltransferase/inosine monophosphate cyclohydrolase [Marinicaulis flavus]